MHVQILHSGCPFYVALPIGTLIKLSLIYNILLIRDILESPSSETDTAAMEPLTRIPPSDQCLRLLQWHFLSNWALRSGDECFTNSTKASRARPLTDDNAAEQFALRGTGQSFV